MDRMRRGGHTRKQMWGRVIGMRDKWYLCIVLLSTTKCEITIQLLQYNIISKVVLKHNQKIRGTKTR